MKRVGEICSIIPLELVYRYSRENMRFLLLLVACFAVSDGFYYSYTRFVQQKLTIPYYASDYKYKIYFRPIWTSTKYYDPILKVYPGKDCGKEGWKETPISEVKTEMEILLKKSLFKTAKEMVTKRTEWLKKLDDKIKEYTDCYTKHMNHYYKSKIEKASAEDKVTLEKERDEKIKSYIAQLAAHRTKALKNYNDSLVKKLGDIIAFHEKLIYKAQKCLVDRQTKIYEYEKKLSEKVYNCVVDYYKHLVENLKKKQEDYEKALITIHGSESFAQQQVEAALSVFYDEEIANIRSKVVAYIKKLIDNQERLVRAYACSYRCYLSTSKLYFSKGYYYKTCRRYSGWSTYPKASYKPVPVKPFTYSWKKTSYNNLKTCDLNTVNKSEDEVAAEVKDRKQKIVAKCNEDFDAWKVKWTKIHESYVEQYKGYVKARHEWVVEETIKYYQTRNKDKKLTPEQEGKIAELKNWLNDKYTMEIDGYTKKLAKSLKDCEAQYRQSLEEYEKRADEAGKKILVCYAFCLSTRSRKIAAYKAKTETSRDEMKQLLHKNIQDKRVDQVKLYISLLRCYHGDKLPKAATDLRDIYEKKLVDFCRSVMDDFDKHYAELVPKLIHHYSCSYKCRADVGLPTYKLGTYNKWTIKNPSASSYKYYYSSYCIKHFTFPTGSNGPL